MKISSSVIKAFEKENYCPRKIHDRYILGLETSEPGVSMQSGTFFESIVTFYNTDSPENRMRAMADEFKKMNINFNNIDDTAILYEQLVRKLCIDIPIEPPSHLFKQRVKNKFGPDTWTTELKRLYYQAAKVYYHLLQYDMFSNDFYVHVRWDVPWNKNEKVILTGEWDMFGFLKYDVPVPTIIDLKFTGSVRNEFGPFCWGTPHLMDHTQAKMYHKMYRLLYKSDCEFMYMVYDKKPVPETLHLKKEYTTLEDYEVDESIRKAYNSYIENELIGWNENPSYDNCKSCLLKQSCKSYIDNPPKPPVIQI